MTEHACTCGYQAEDADDLTVHFGEVFTPADDTTPDGQVHAETARDATTPHPAPGTLACRCGYMAPIADFDRHLADVFTPADRTGPDGQRHEPVQAGHGG
jgi:hypothetical protein